MKEIEKKVNKEFEAIKDQLTEEDLSDDYGFKPLVNLDEFTS